MFPRGFSPRRGKFRRWLHIRPGCIGLDNKTRSISRMRHSSVQPSPGVCRDKYKRQNIFIIARWKRTSEREFTLPRCKWYISRREEFVKLVSHTYFFSFRLFCLIKSTTPQILVFHIFYLQNVAVNKRMNTVILDVYFKNIKNYNYLNFIFLFKLIYFI